VPPARLDSGQTVEARTAPRSLVHMAKKLRAWAISRKPYGIGSSARRIRLTNRRRIKVKIPTSCRVQACRKDTNHFLQTFPRNHPEPVGKTAARHWHTGSPQPEGEGIYCLFCFSDLLIRLFPGLLERQGSRPASLARVFVANVARWRGIS
jgi:hypothetical protein